jgi:poly-gamma-glutamate synthesis protein (capsule biosynthesis protein)
VAVLATNPGSARFFRREVLISVAGDILLARGVADAIAENGASYPYGAVSELFGRDDLTGANLECPLTAGGAGAMNAARFVFRADPSNADVLKSAGVRRADARNNHTMDYLSAGLNDTMAALEGAGLRYAGAGDSGDAIEPCFVEINGVRTGILAYSSLPPEGFMYDGGSATVAYARAGYLEDMRAEIAGAAARCDFLLSVSIGAAGTAHDVSRAQLEIARAGRRGRRVGRRREHPHVLQCKETAKTASELGTVSAFRVRQADTGGDGRGCDRSADRRQKRPHLRRRAPGRDRALPSAIGRWVKSGRNRGGPDTVLKTV